MEILHLENVSFRYPTAAENAIDGVSLRVQSGEFVVVCGESGCGKTTLLRLLKRALAPAGTRSGEIYYCGVAQSALSERTEASEIGYVLQNPDNQIVTDKVWHELAFGLENLGLELQTIRLRVAEMAQFFALFVECRYS